MTIRPFLPPTRTLMGPGPSDIHPRVLQAMARPTIGHMDPEFIRMMEEFGLEIGAGLGPMAGKIWRIGLMGHSSNPKNVTYCVSVLKTVLG